MDHDDWCGSPAGCGDRKTATRPTGAGWNQTIRYSRGDGTSWMTEGAAGRLWAFAVLDGRMAYWSRSGPKAPWQGPRFLVGTGIDAGATTVRLPDGRIAVFATRTTLGPTPRDYGRALVYCVQDKADGAFGPWQSLGTPDPDTADASVTTAIGAPAAAVDPAGRLTVYVRDSRRTLRARTQTAPDGAFGAWQSLGGAGLLGDPVTATDGSGRRHVYAATAGSVLAWVQSTPDAPLTGAFATGLPQTTGVLSVRPEGDGVRLFFRRPGSGTVGTSLATAGGPAPEFSPVAEAGGPGGYGAVGVAGPLLAGRTGSGTVGVVGAGGPQSWQESRMLYTGAPSGVADRSGTAVAAALGLDADLHIVTPAGPADAQPPGDRIPSPWHRAVQPRMLAQAREG
ncbi:PIG-L family deacetylase, partial [Streptomyces sp. SID7760]|nr:PIG-L family deacetylase [Streptomyces sp. SID7760]